jgi:hypothetical protein
MNYGSLNLIEIISAIEKGIKIQNRTLGSNWHGGPADAAKTTSLVVGPAQKHGGRCTARASWDSPGAPRCARSAHTWYSQRRAIKVSAMRGSSPRALTKEGAPTGQCLGIQLAFEKHDDGRMELTSGETAAQRWWLTREADDAPVRSCMTDEQLGRHRDNKEGKGTSKCNSSPKGKNPRQCSTARGGTGEWLAGWEVRCAALSGGAPPGPAHEMVAGLSQRWRPTMMENRGRSHGLPTETVGAAGRQRTEVTPF